MIQHPRIEQHSLVCAGGHVLNIQVYRSVERVELYSSILVMTPYGAQRYQQDGQRFSTAGFAMVVVDSRGCGASSGCFEPFEHDGEDARHVIRWIVTQAWSNGRVGMYGGSYSGFVQWAACKEPVGGLKSLAPVASVHPGVDFPAVNGLLYLYASRWLAYVAQRAEDEERYLDNGFWNNRLRAVSASNPAALIAAAGNQAVTLRRWLYELGNDKYWQRLLPDLGCMAGLDIPALFITGTHDDDQRGTLGYYTQLSERQRGKSLLVIGPWDHDGTRQPRACFGGLEHNSASCLDLLELHIQWYRFTLDGGARPAICRLPVLYYMAGRECWFESTSFAQLSDRKLTLHCAAAGGLGYMPVSSKSISMILPGPAPCIGNVMEHEPTYRASSQLLESAAGVAFTSAAGQQPLALCGVPSVTLYLRVGRSADVCVRLYALLPDRTALYLGASNRKVDRAEGFYAQPWLFDSFNLICRELPASSQVRAIVSLSDPSLWLSDNDMQTEVELHYGGDCPCTLSLPLQALATRND
ncbi:CocE/NonD family hydrolase [Pseudomonas asiatica]|uniref:CocE/NonD family hydrolase n=1 Tax=Pseudomonas asiatica TaxID=2219225 RepID=UPI00209AD52F|nr:CocE/NonD family hydrolase [Pseudomonas asiatica]MCO7535997.1 CocE/NonD family hydrolase [Pseudomonas asiatica]MCO7549575.1 CocE/NonD family hydrolase [Pseudomonas asiatica]MCO7559721.1 CocE/NonD family hydrolase [Pseudomonas asiatica]